MFLVALQKCFLQRYNLLFEKTNKKEFNCFFILFFSLAQRKRTKRDIHPFQGLPLYGEDATEKSVPSFQSFGMTHKAFAPTG